MHTCLANPLGGNVVVHVVPRNGVDPINLVMSNVGGAPSVGMHECSVFAATCV